MSLIYLILVYVFFFRFDFRSSINENVFWYIVEVLNNNNKSILLYCFIFFMFIMLLGYQFNSYVLFFKCLYYIIFLFFVFLLKLDNDVFNNNINNFFKINTNLINGIVLIHPILVYITYVFFKLGILQTIKNIKHINMNLFFFKKYNKKLFLISLFALFLGGWWAQQELNWGGWWNWDFVEIIALIFNILSLYIIHSNLYKNYNYINNLNTNIVYYLLIFFLFVRMDVLNSIHSFNSFSVLNNFNKFLIIFIYLFIIIIIKFSIKFFKKFKFNSFTNLSILSIFFKIVNCLFLYYFFLNLYFIIYLNYQFIDITKFIKIILLIFLYIMIILEFTIYNFLCLILFSFFLNQLDILNIMVYFNIIHFFKKNQFNLNTSLLIISHVLLLIFIINVEYYVQCFYKNDFKINYLNNSITISEIFSSNASNNFFFNDFKFFKTILNNFTYNISYNNFYYKFNTFINNIIVNNNIFVYYNVDNILYLELNKINLTFYILLFIFFLI